jgi:hypothetical protein
LHYIFAVGAPQSPAKPLQDYIVLNEIVADCRRWARVNPGLSYLGTFGPYLDITDLYLSVVKLVPWLQAQLLDRR